MNFFGKKYKLNYYDIENIVLNKNKVFVFLLSVLGGFIHFFYFIYYLLLGINIYALLNLISVLVYIFAFIMLVKKHVTLCTDLVSMEVLIYSIITSCISGYGMNSIWFIGIILVTHLVFLENTKGRIIFYTIACLISLNFITIWFFFIDPIYPQAATKLIIMINSNLFIFLSVFEFLVLNILETFLKKKYENSLETARNESFIDPMTRLWNRRYLDNIKPDLEKLSEKGNNISIAIIDIDDFKKINDKFGHSFGDEVLKVLSREMINNFRTYDNVIRYGGEEFLVIMKNADEIQAFKSMDRFRYIMNNIEIKKDEETSITITFTSGISNLKYFNNFEKCLQKADERLYFGKKTGKNKVVFKD